MKSYLKQMYLLSRYTLRTLHNIFFCIQDCITKPCVRGTCVSSFSGYTCKCLTGYKGTKCDQGLYKC